MEPDVIASKAAPAIMQGMQTDPLMAMLGVLISSQSRIAEVLTNLFSGFGLTSPAGQVNTLASTFSYLFGQTSIAQMFGIENPLRAQSGYKAIVDQFYPARAGMDPYLMYDAYRYVSSYNKITDALNTTDPWTLRPFQQTELIAQLSRSNMFTLDELKQLGDKDSEAFSKVRSAEEAVITADKLLGIKDMASALNVMNIMGGTSNIKENAKIFKEYIATLVSEGLSMGEMMQSVQDNMQMNKALRARGFSASMAASIANQASMADAAAEKLGKSGIMFDKIGAKNTMASILADYSVGEGYEQTVAYIAADQIKDEGKREDYYNELDAAGNDLKKIAEIQERYGVRDYAEAVRKYNNSNRGNLYGSPESMSRAQLSSIKASRVSAENLLRSEWEYHEIAPEIRQKLETIMGKLRSGEEITAEEANTFRTFSGEQALGTLSSLTAAEKGSAAAEDYRNILARTMAGQEGNFNMASWSIIQKDNWKNMINTMGPNNTAVETKKFKEADFIKEYMKSENVTEADAKKVYDSLQESYNADKNKNYAAAITGGKSGNMYRMTENGVEAILGSDIANYQKQQAEESTSWFKPLLSELGKLFESLGETGSGSIREDVKSIANNMERVANNYFGVRPPYKSM